MTNRLEKLAASLPEDLDAALITSDCNRLYYTGLASSAGTLLVTRRGSVFLIDSRYIEVARNTVHNCEVVLLEKMGEQLRSLVKRYGLRRIGIESGYCTVSQFLSWKKELPECELVMDERVNDLICRQRMVKDEGELALIRQAQELTDRSFDYICGFIRPGMSEKEIALELEFYSRRIGSEGPSFEFIVVSGPNSSLPHGVPGQRKVEKGDFITMDFGCIIGGYHSDMTRTVALGEPDGEMRRVYATVLEANRRSMAAVAPGVKCADVDKVARDIIYGAGYEGCFGHGLGHGVGVEIHEADRFGMSSKGECMPGMVMTIEPGIYLEGRFGCRIEDMIYITAEGCINLTASNKELIIL